MRSAPPLQVELTRYGLWRVMVAVLAATACAAMAAWWWEQAPPVPPTASAAALIGTLIALACTIALWHVSPLTLRWDRQRWHVATRAAASPRSHESTGELAVALDLGSWMLLRFVPDRPPAGPPWRRRRPQWIPLQRRGLEPQWHLLRCALYAARPAPPETRPA